MIRGFQIDKPLCEPCANLCTLCVLKSNLLHGYNLKSEERILTAKDALKKSTRPMNQETVSLLKAAEILAANFTSTTSLESRIMFLIALALLMP